MLSSVTRVESEPTPDHAQPHAVRMRDGVRLAADVYLPAGGEPAPAILVRLPYDKASRYSFFPLLAPTVTARGYALVVQDVRGKFGSEGQTLAFVHEVDDGWDTLEWLVNQSWCDGAVGMFGDSYYGFTQWAALASGHPALRAMVPRMTSSRLGTVRRGGPVSADSLTRPVPQLVEADYLAHYWADRHIYDVELDWELRPIAAIFDRAAEAIGTRSATLDMLMPHRVAFPTFGGHDPFGGRPIPILHSVGWFDNLAAAQMADYAELASKPAWAPLQYLIADSVDHENYRLSDTPIDERVDHNENDAALERLFPHYVGPALDFFDVFLTGRRAAGELPQVAWDLGNAGPRSAPAWPPPGTAERALQLTADGALAAEAGTPGTATWTHDPRNLIPSAVENAFAFLAEFPDEAATAARDDVVAFTSAPLEEPLDLAGPVQARLSLTTTGPTTDLFVKLLDVAPDGTARMVVRGETQVVRPLEQPAQVTVSLGHTGYRVRPGHRLRLHVSSSDYPLYLPNPGTDENPWLATDTRPTTQTLQLGAGAGSQLLLTVLKEGDDE